MPGQPNTNINDTASVNLDTSNIASTAHSSSTDIDSAASTAHSSSTSIEPATSAARDSDTSTDNSASPETDGYVDLKGIHLISHSDFKIVQINFFFD